MPARRTVQPSHAVFVGPLPPPVTGQTLAGQGLVETLRARVDCRIITLGTQRSATATFCRGRAAKVWRHMTAALHLILHRPPVILLSLERRAGQYLQAGTLLLSARARRRLVVILHHSWDGVRLTPLLRYALGIGGGHTLHVALCESHLQRVIRHNHALPRTSHIALSNSSWMAAGGVTVEQGPPECHRLRPRILMFSNLTYEKGAGVFISVAHLARDDSFGADFVMAGPVSSEALQSEIDRAVASGIVDYLGPIVPEKRFELLAGADLVIFPSDYECETEPLVVLEALSVGTPVLGSRLGCITEMLPDEWTVGRRSHPDVWVDRISVFGFDGARSQAARIWDQLATDADSDIAEVAKRINEALVTE